MNSALGNYFKEILRFANKILHTEMLTKILYIIVKNLEVINDGRFADYGLILKECHRIKQNDSWKITKQI